MTQSEQQQKIVQYLNEAHAMEHALVRVLQAQIAMTPRGAYRSGLETHLGETRDHARRVGQRLQDLDQGSNPLMAVLGVVETAVGQVLALGKTPFDLLRGSGGEEKVLKNAKDAYASEALEIATYTALERLAETVGDTQTARLAASILADEEKMLARVLREIPTAHRRGRIDGERPTTSPRPVPPRRPRRPSRPPSAPRARPARSPASPAPKARSRARWPPRATSRSRATTRSRPTRSSAASASSPRST